MFINKRELVEDEFGNVYEVNGFWYSKTGYIIKWVLFLSIFLIFFLWIVGGYIHARRRMKKNMAPLAYHRWLVPRSQLARFQPQNHFTFYQAQPYSTNQYGMNNYPEPPPVYNNGDMPPQYYAPPGPAKPVPTQNTFPSQQGQQETGVANGSSNETQATEPELPPRAKTKVASALRFLRR